MLDGATAKWMVSIGVPLVISIGSVYAALKWRIPMLAKDIKGVAGRVKELESIKFVSKEELYEKSGELKFLPVKMCELNQGKYQRVICSDIKLIRIQITDLKDDLRDMGGRGETTRSDLVNAMKDMAAIRQQLEDLVALSQAQNLEALAEKMAAKIMKG